ncbi:COG5 [Candida pseudojiufengensis]|uniref:COG5 n=1 Tax=Candida pseudojiufengensis TaxID=497109 RepID=UPI00222439FB|nr:COG5 [Candida pseudojiufengensis]KAI5963674.1 COG5 [Candida pseudojiufengensis]
MGEKITSRSNLYNSESEEENDDNDQYIAPSLDFEFVEVDKEDEHNKNEKAEEKEPEDEFAFPLFASSVSITTKPNTQETEERGRSKTQQHQSVQKISLREHSEERINNERPDSYYFASYTSDQKFQFEQVAVSYNDIYSQITLKLSSPSQSPGKVINLNQHNQKIEEILAKEKLKKSKRPGKKKRESKIYCKQRRLERIKIAKQEEKNRKAKAKQEKYGKFNKFKTTGGGASDKKFGRVNKKSFKNDKPNGKFAKNKNQVQQKPKYRTEKFSHFSSMVVPTANLSNELEDFEAYLEPDFNSTSFANSLLIASNGNENQEIDFQTPIKKLKYDLIELDKRIKNISSNNYEALINNFVQINQYQQIQEQQINPNLDTINKQFDKIKKEYIEPYDEAQRLTNALKNLLHTLELLRSASFFIFIIQQLEDLSTTSNDSNDKDLVKISKLYIQLSKLYESSKKDIKEKNNIMSIKLIRDYEQIAYTRKQNLIQNCSSTIINEFNRVVSINHKNLKLYNNLRALYILDTNEFFTIFDKSTIQKELNISNNQMTKALQSPRNFTSIITEIKQNNDLYFASLNELLQKWQFNNDTDINEKLGTIILNHYNCKSLDLLFWQKLSQSFKRNIVATMARGGPIAKNLRVYSQGLKKSIEDTFGGEEEVKNYLLEALSMIDYK